jgi:hypothetical protein
MWQVSACGTANWLQRRAQYHLRMDSTIVEHEGAPVLASKSSSPRQIKFCGVWIGGDIKELKAKFECALTRDDNLICLGVMAHKRGITESGTIKLDALNELVLKEKMNKDDAVRCSDWSQSTLTKEQNVYATLDAIKPLDIYFELSKLKNLAACLLVSEATKETKVDVFASNGTIVAMAFVVAAGFIKSEAEGDVWNPPGCLATRQNNLHVTLTRHLVRIEKVYGNRLKVPYLSKANEDPIWLGELAEISTGPFDIILPIQMISPFIPEQTENLIAMEFGSHLKEPTQEEGPVAQVEPAPKQSITNNPYAKPSKQPIQNACHQTKCKGPSSTSEAASAESSESNEVAAGTESIESIDEVEYLDMDEEIDYSSLNLSKEDIKWISFCMQTTNSKASMAEVTTAMICPQLNAPPSVIEKNFRSVTGDGYHFMECPPIPIRHSLKKSYKVALREAWYCWKPKRFKKAVQKLKDEWGSDQEIMDHFFFNTSNFLGCCARGVPPPTILYWRVRAVFAFYGNRICTHTSKPLFNKTSWKKANNLLEEILQGYASDVSGESYYRLRLESH